MSKENPIMPGLSDEAFYTVNAKASVVLSILRDVHAGKADDWLDPLATLRKLVAEMAEVVEEPEGRLAADIVKTKKRSLSKDERIRILSAFVRHLLAARNHHDKEETHENSL